MIDLVPTPAPLVPSRWAEVEPYVARALVKGASLSSVEAFKASCEDRTRQLWVIREDGATTGCIITEVYDTAKGLTCALPVAAGMDRHIDPGIACIEAWARAEGCVRMEFSGRPGWQRRMKAAGWTPLTVTLEKELV